MQTNIYFLAPRSSGSLNKAKVPTLKHIKQNVLETKKNMYTNKTTILLNLQKQSE